MSSFAAGAARGVVFGERNIVKIMAKKTKKSRKVVSYLRELSVVVLGVAITLGASTLISARNAKKDLDLYLNAVKMEMEGNMKLLDEQRRYIMMLNGAGDYLRSAPLAELRRDDRYFDEIRQTLENESDLSAERIDYYEKMLELGDELHAAGSGGQGTVNDSNMFPFLWQNVFFGVYPAAYDTNAFDMLKISGSMRLIGDKELLQEIWKSYNTLNRVQNVLNDYMERKMEKIQAGAKRPYLNQTLNILDPEHSELYIFYTYTMTVGIEYNMKEWVGQTRRTLELF